MSEGTVDVKKTVLHDWHVDSGAKMMAFGGYDMPIQYQTIFSEHIATRTAAGLFEKRGFTYQGLVEGEQAAEAYGVGGIPHIFLIDREGVVADQWIGFGHEQGAVIEERVLEVLGG